MYLEENSAKRVFSALSDQLLWAAALYLISACQLLNLWVVSFEVSSRLFPTSDLQAPHTQATFGYFGRFTDSVFFSLKPRPSSSSNRSGTTGLWTYHLIQFLLLSATWTSSNPMKDGIMLSRILRISVTFNSFGKFLGSRGIIKWHFLFFCTLRGQEVPTMSIGRT